MPTVVAALELYDLLSAGYSTGKSYRMICRLCSRVAEKHFLTREYALHNPRGSTNLKLSRSRAKQVNLIDSFLDADAFLYSGTTAS